MVPSLNESNEVDFPGADASVRAGRSFFVWPGRLVASPAIRRLVSVPLVFLVSVVSFFFLSLAPGNAARAAYGFNATAAQIAAYNHEHGLDLPLYQQYWRWLGDALHGDLGISYLSFRPVASIIMERIQVSVSLIVGSLLLLLVIGVPLGIATTSGRGAVGKLGDLLALIGYALPPFWIGVILIEVFAVDVHWFPAVGYVPIGQSLVQWLQSLILPWLALSVGGIAFVAKTTRDAMLDVLSSEHVRAAWANGVPARRVYFVYALKNAALRIVTIFGVLTIGLLSGTVLVETVFALPGLGSALVNAVSEKDLPTVQGIVVLFTAIIVFVNLIVDLVYVRLDPRARIR